MPKEFLLVDLMAAFTIRLNIEKIKLDNPEKALKRVLSILIHTGVLRKAGRSAYERIDQ